MMISKQQLENFVKIQNEKAPNIVAHAKACNIDPKMFERPQHLRCGGYIWRFREGIIVEVAGRRKRFALHPPGTAINIDTGDPMRRS